MSISYTFDKNNKFYDKNWISNHFNKEEIDLVNNPIQENRKKTINNIKKQAKFTISFFIIGWLIVLLILGIVYFS